MKALFVGGCLIVVSMNPRAVQASDSILSALQAPRGVIQVEPFSPAQYSDLPQGAKYGNLTEADYQKCIQDLPRSNRLYFKMKYFSGTYRVEGFLAVPKNLSLQGRYPYVLYNRGGNRNFGSLQACGLLVMNSLFLSDDRSVLFAPQFRGALGSEGKDEYGGGEIEDLFAARNILLQMPFIDPKNAFMVGWSRGGMTSYIALKRGMILNAVAVLAGIPDLHSVDQSRPDMKKVFDELIPGIEKNRKAALDSRSAVAWPEALKSPLLILHGQMDVKAPIGPVLRLDRELTQLGKPHRLVVYPQAGHFFEGAERDLGEQVRAWFKLYSISH